MHRIGNPASDYDPKRGSNDLITMNYCTVKYVENQRTCNPSGVQWCLTLKVGPNSFPEYRPSFLFPLLLERTGGGDLSSRCRGCPARVAAPVSSPAGEDISSRDFPDHPSAIAITGPYRRNHPREDKNGEPGENRNRGESLPVLLRRPITLQPPLHLRRSFPSPAIRGADPVASPIRSAALSVPTAPLHFRVADGSFRILFPPHTALVAVHRRTTLIDPRLSVGELGLVGASLRALK